jgi:septum formation protein
MTLILASGSPRRAELLRAAGFDFLIQAESVDESRLEGEAAERMVERLALLKASTVAKIQKEDAIVVGTDTVVTIGGEILGKPGNPEVARAMLRKLRGREHRVITGVALLAVKQLSPSAAVMPIVFHEITRVWMSQMTDKEIEDYVATGEPLDKAGAYAIQGQASRFIPRIDGCYFNVVGLPVSKVSQMLARFREELRARHQD